ncbi:MAG: glycosyltransferase family 25 protein [Actinomycetota bacterium]
MNSFSQDGRKAPTLACFVLGLKNRFRGTELINDLTEKGFDPEIVYGVDASTDSSQLLDKVDHAASRLLQGRNLSLGEVACSLGHLSIMEKFLGGSEEWALIFEDDVVLASDPKAILPYLSEISGPTVIQLHRSIPDDKTVLSRRRISIGTSYQLISKLNFSSGAYAYLMNREAAQIAVNSSAGKRIINIPDWPYLWRHKVKFWELSVNLAGYQGESLLDPDRKSESEVLHSTHHKRVRKINRALTFLKNVVGIPSYKFHRLGYPGWIVYYNNVIMPFRRRTAIFMNSIPRVDSKP